MQLKPYSKLLGKRYEVLDKAIGLIQVINVKYKLKTSDKCVFFTSRRLTCACQCHGLSHCDQNYHCVRRYSHVKPCTTNESPNPEKYHGKLQKGPKPFPSCNHPKGTFH